MTDKDIIIAGLFIGIFLLITCIYFLYKEYAKLQEIIKDMQYTRPPAIPDPEKYTIVDLFYEEKVDRADERDTDRLEAHLFDAAANSFLNEIRYMGGLKTYHERPAYFNRPTRYRFGIKIALKDE